jgi:hypothetical protein
MSIELKIPSSFPRFSQLPPELRLKIWEETWPEARVLEITSGECLEEAGWDDGWASPGPISLRPMCSMSRWTQEIKDGTYRNFEDEEPLEACPDPVALQVCHESRVHTLSRYIKMQHNDLENLFFYMDPRVDMLWLSEDASDNVDKYKELQTYYGNQLDSISHVLIQEPEWDTREYLDDFFEELRGLDRVHVVVDRHALAGLISEQSRGQNRTTTATLGKVLAYLRWRDRPRSLLKAWEVVYGILD